MAESSIKMDISFTEINKGTICDLLRIFSQNAYNVSGSTTNNTHLDQVMSLMERDYIIQKITNEDGNKCFHYPSTIPIMVSPRFVSKLNEKNSENVLCSLDLKVLEELMDKAKFARCRQRFPVPVILFENQNICRSATIASVPEVCYRLLNKIADVNLNLFYSVKELLWPSEDTFVDKNLSDTSINTTIESSLPPYCDTIRNDDVILLKTMNVNAIFDIMVEKRKIKHNLYVSASEKVDKQRFADFNLISLPYPGCEFFKEFHDKMFESDGLMYNWNNPLNDAELTIPNNNLKESLNIKWDDYKQWDLTLMTQNYIKYIIKYLQKENEGILLHCISGWDRTPLFISLIRLSLWADGLIHPSLDAYEITYLTLAYDWYLFGHRLCDRLVKGEEIMTFCFAFLRYIESDEFSAKSPQDGMQYQEFGNLPEIPAIITEDKAYEATSKLEQIEENSDGEIMMLIENGNCYRSRNGSSSDEYIEDIIERKRGGITPITLPVKKTSPVSSGSPNKRSRANSSGSTDSWQMVNECAAVEDKNMLLHTERSARLAAVRKIFMSNYQTTLKNECYGPQKNYLYSEEMADYISKIWNIFKSKEIEDESNSVTSKDNKPIMINNPNDVVHAETDMKQSDADKETENDNFMDAESNDDDVLVIDLK